VTGRPNFAGAGSRDRSIVVRSSSVTYNQPVIRNVARLRGPGARPRRADGPGAFLAFQLSHRRLGAGSMNPLAVNALANAIQTQEGYYPGSVAYTNNNPGNLVYAGQAGATAGPGGFAVFSSYAAGYQALQNQITLDASRGTDVNGNPVQTVGDLISSWAPASAGNDTASYISSVEQQTGFSASDNLLSLGTSDAGSLAPMVPGLTGDSTPTAADVLSGLVEVPSAAWVMMLVAGAALFLYSK
jgi:hypothetical protein